MASIAHKGTESVPASESAKKAASERRMTASENLRRETRLDARVRVVVVRGRRTIPLVTTDISFKGLFLQTDEPQPLRSLLRLRVTLPLREIEVHAMAVHVTTPADVAAANGHPDPVTARGAGVGVQFWGLAGPERSLWDDFVREQIAQKKKSAKK
jgi:hypothetical protein